MTLSEFEKRPILGILRGVDPALIEPLMEAVSESGLKTIEITMNTPKAADVIEKAKKISGGRIDIGAGTVLGMEDLKKALGSGATFIVMPVLIKEVVEYCVKKNIPSFPGALTPQEIYGAHTAGASMVKVFPSGIFGPSYFKELKGPFKDIKLLACGGVTADNMQDYFQSGASAVAFGASVFKKEWLDRKDFDSIKKSIRRFTEQDIKSL